MQAAQRTDSRFEPDTAGMQTVARICQAVQGMPLAILLAAPWVTLLSLEEICGEIQMGLDLLAADLRDVPDRHRSVRATFLPTWNRLSEEDALNNFKP